METSPARWCNLLRNSILMPFSRQKQITLRDILRYEDIKMKYECLPQIAFSNSEIFTVVFSECRGSDTEEVGGGGMNFWSSIWFGRHNKRIASISQEHCYLDCWMKMKYCMMQVSERGVETLPSVWRSWQFWEPRRWWAIMLFAQVGFGSFCLSTSSLLAFNPAIITTLPQCSSFTGRIFFAHTLFYNFRVPPQP